jgi:hypothetical protein
MTTNLSFCLVLGQHNSGSNDVARFLSKNLPNSVFEDGTQCLSSAIIANLGDHRNDFSLSRQVAALLAQQTLIASMSAGVLLDYKGNPVFLKYLKTVFGEETTVIITLLLPKVYSSSDPLLILDACDKDEFFREDSPHRLDLRTLYLSKAENPADEKKKSAIYDIFNKVIDSLATVVGKIVFLPTAVDEITEPYKQSLIQSLQTLTPPRIEREPFHTQKRFLTEHGEGDAKKVHHITIEYNPAGVPYVPPLRDPLQRHVRTTVNGRLQTCPSNSLVIQMTALNDAVSTIIADTSLHSLIPSQFRQEVILEDLAKLSRTIELLMIDFSTLQDAEDAEFVKTINSLIGKSFKIILESSRKINQSNELTGIIEVLDRQKFLKIEPKGQLLQFIVFPSLFEGELGTKAHITVNYGPHKPADMRIAAQCVYSGAEIISIGDCNYRYDTGKDISVEILQIYYI